VSKSGGVTNTTVLNPQVHLLGDDAAVIAYGRLTQSYDKLVTWQFVFVLGLIVTLTFTH